LLEAFLYVCWKGPNVHEGYASTSYSLQQCIYFGEVEKTHIGA